MLAGGVVGAAASGTVDGTAAGADSTVLGLIGDGIVIELGRAAGITGLGNGAIGNLANGLAVEFGLLAGGSWVTLTVFSGAGFGGSFSPGSGKKISSA